MLQQLFRRLLGIQTVETAEVGAIDLNEAANIHKKEKSLNLRFGKYGHEYTENQMKLRHLRQM
ncbi:hypothetical protein FZC84_21100 [Rossellomorea vietnamensis]|uniref:Uncharacterized protein n=1 Tax=Rossellomorea vietnamensis TaxID=218284 RepID=A0A5D4M281_9BACI|nr:hypothetical protein [Rossellomorea vietnamensis]TYR95692.1 hypothetical protein FZC84_21100 [Rossellomorea vietnamensis]